MIGRLRQLSEPRLRQQVGIEKSQTHVERDILVQWVRIASLMRILSPTENMIPHGHIVLTKRSTGYETFVLTADQSDLHIPGIINCL